MEMVSEICLVCIWSFVGGFGSVGGFFFGERGGGCGWCWGFVGSCVGFGALKILAFF